MAYVIPESPIMFDAKKRIAAASPHIETQSNVIISMTAGGRYPFKKFSVTIPTYQAGTGNPGLDNVRAFIPVNSLTVYKAPYRNLLNIYDTYPAGSVVVSNGITWTVNNNRTVTANGTATATSVIHFFVPSSLPTGRYYMTTGSLSGTNNPNERTFDNYMWDNRTGARPNMWDDKTPMQTLSRQWSQVRLIQNNTTRISLRVQAGQTVNNAVCYPAVTNSPIESVDCDIQGNAESVYGGTIDLAQGSLTVTKALITVSDASNIRLPENNISSEGTAIMCWCTLSGIDTYTEHPLCDSLSYVGKGYTGHYLPEQGTAGEYGTFDDVTNGVWMWLPYGGADGVQEATLTGVGNYLSEHPVSFVGDLVEQRTYQLTPSILYTSVNPALYMCNIADIDTSYYTH